MIPKNIQLNISGCSNIVRVIQVQVLGMIINILSVSTSPSFVIHVFNTPSLQSFDYDIVADMSDFCIL